MNTIFYFTTHSSVIRGLETRIRMSGAGRVVQSSLDTDGGGNVGLLCDVSVNGGLDVAVVTVGRLGGVGDGLGSVGGWGDVGGLCGVGRLCCVCGVGRLCGVGLGGVGGLGVGGGLGSVGDVGGRHCAATVDMRGGHGWSYSI